MSSKNNLGDEVLRGFSADNRKRAPSRDEIYQFVADAIEILSDQMREQKKRIDKLEANAGGKKRDR